MKGRKALIQNQEMEEIQNLDILIVLKGQEAILIQEKMEEILV